MADLKKYDDHMNGVSYSHVHENQKAVMNRLSRAIGHLEKVKRMVGNGEDCANILLQILSQSAFMHKPPGGMGITDCFPSGWRFCADSYRCWSGTLRGPPGTHRGSQ